MSPEQSIKAAQQEAKSALERKGISKGHWLPTSYRDL